MYMVLLVRENTIYATRKVTRQQQWSQRAVLNPNMKNDSTSMLSLSLFLPH